MRKEILYALPLFICMAMVAIYAIVKPLPEGHKESATYAYEPMETETQLIEALNNYIHSKAEEANEAIKATEPATEPTTEEETIPYTEPFKPFNVAMSAEVQREVYYLCGAYEIDFVFFMGWMYSESHCEWKIGSHNDTGYMQIIPQYHEASARNMGIDIFSEVGNCEYAMVLLNGFLKDEGGDLQRALQRYNTGSATNNNGYYEWVLQNVNYMRERYEG